MRERALFIVGRSSDITRSRYGALVTTVRLATSDDIGRLTTTAVRAFADDPLLRWFFPDDGEYHDLAPPSIAYLCRRWQATESQWCTDDGVALAGWAPPGRPEVDVERPALTHTERRLARFVALDAARNEHTPAEPHWYLNMLATHPDWQRQGLGAALMGEVFRIADDQGLPCYLETETSANVAYYRHHGFEVRSEFDLAIPGDPGPHMWGMLRALTS
jgi:ribosomal protein S18 acetylase RimI-like enzyme